MAVLVVMTAAPIHLTLRQCCAGALALLALAAPSAGAWEQFQLNASTSVRRDDNIFRLPESADGPSDTLFTQSVGGSGQLTLSRQQVLFNLNLTQTRYQTFSPLDNDGGDGQAVWKWAVGRFPTGDLGIRRSRAQSSFAETFGSASNLLTTTQKFFNVDYPFHSAWRLSGGISRSESSNSDLQNRVSDNIATTVNSQLRYQTGKGNSIGVQTTRIDADYPSPFFAGMRFDNSYMQHTTGLTVTYITGGSSNLQGAISRTQRELKQTSAAASRATTGNLSWAWRPTGKTALDLFIGRDYSPPDALVTSGSVADTLRLGVNWAATAKISVRGDLAAQQLNYTQAAGATPLLTPERRDDLRSASLTATYAIFRHLTLTLGAQREQRDSSLPTLSYRANSVSASAQLGF